MRSATRRAIIPKQTAVSASTTLKTSARTNECDSNGASAMTTSGISWHIDDEYAPD